jgi:hypothetical protein
MHHSLHLSMALLWLGCWAPEIAEVGEEAPADDQASHQDHPGSIGPGGRELPKVSHGISSPESFPAPPFTAWTVQTPLSIQGANSESGPLVTVHRRGVRIEVLQVLPDQKRMMVRCDGCPSDDGSVVQGFLQTSKGIRVKGSPGDDTDPLARILQLRARWAGERDLPAGAHRNAMCGLVDRGFSLEGNSAIWSHDGGRVELRFIEGEWQLNATTSPKSATDGSCRTTQ